MPDTVKSSPHQAPKMSNTITTNGTGTAAMSAEMTRMPTLIRRAAVKLSVEQTSTSSKTRI
jgi:hypothetical protein